MPLAKGLRRIRRLLYLGAAFGGVVALRRAILKREPRTTLGAPSTWPPLTVGEAPVAAVGDLVTAAEPTPHEHEPPADTIQPLAGDEPVAAVGELAAEAPRPVPPWVEPEDGVCPLSHPVKANGSSGIYHLPGGQFYDRTRPQRCYVDAATAEADGYRAAKG